MLRSRQRRAWWIAGALGLLLAILGVLLLAPGIRPTPQVLQITLVEPVRYEPPPTWAPPPPPPPAPAQPVPPPPAADGTPSGMDHASRLDRADWIGGGVVVCDVRGLSPDAHSAVVEPDKGISLEGAVDVVSRIAPVQEGHIWLTVREPQGEVNVLLSSNDEGPPDLATSVRARLRWSGAEAGETVGCSALWQPPVAQLRVTVTDAAGTPFEAGPAQGLVMVRGCGLMLPLFQSPLVFPIEAGTCTLRVERRNASFPLPVAVSEWTAVRLMPGETLDLTLIAPDEPPIYKPPELHELQAIADIAAWGGSVALAEAVQELVDDLLAGRWSPESLAELEEQLRPEQAPDIDELEVTIDGGPLPPELLDTGIE